MFQDGEGSGNEEEDNGRRETAGTGDGGDGGREDGAMSVATLAGMVRFAER